jgi:hypothetical protein
MAHANAISQIVCTDSRATAGSWIASQTVKKVIPVSRLSRGEDKASDKPTPGLLGTMAGGAAVSFCVVFVGNMGSWLLTGGPEKLGLPILVEIFEPAVYSPRYVCQMGCHCGIWLLTQTPRNPTQAPHHCCGCFEDPRQLDLRVQGVRAEHGNDAGRGMVIPTNSLPPSRKND